MVMNVFCLLHPLQFLAAFPKRRVVRSYESLAENRLRVRRVCVCERERERERALRGADYIGNHVT